MWPIPCAGRFRDERWKTEIWYDGGDPGVQRAFFLDALVRYKKGDGPEPARSRLLDEYLRQLDQWDEMLERMPWPVRKIVERYGPCRS